MTSQVQTQIQNLQNWVICEPFNLPESHEYYVKGVYKLQLMCHSIPCYMTVGSMVKPINAILPLNDIVNNIVSKLGEWEALLVEDLTFYDEKRVEIGCHDYIDVTEHYIIVAKLYGQLVMSQRPVYYRRIESVCDP